MSKTKLNEYLSSVYSRDNLPVAPTAHIQWKGTNVCMDVACACGAEGHIDGDFTYFLKCEACGAMYATGQVIRLIPLSPEERQVHKELDWHEPFVFKDLR